MKKRIVFSAAVGIAVFIAAFAVLCPTNTFKMYSAPNTEPETVLTIADIYDAADCIVSEDGTVEPDGIDSQIIFQVPKTNAQCVALSIENSCGRDTAELYFANDFDFNSENVAVSPILEENDTVCFNLDNAENVRSRRTFNRYIIDYPTVFSANYLKQHLMVETAVYIKAYPCKKMQATSIIYDYLHENGFDNLIEQYGLEPFEVNVQVAERTPIDKLYALGDYYLSGAISEHSRHIYDVYKLLEIVPLDDKLKALAKKVYIEREPHEQCRSAKPWVEMNKLLQEIIDVEAYKKDYEDITMKMLFEKIDYETAASKLQQVVEHGLFE